MGKTPTERVETATPYALPCGRQCGPGQWGVVDASFPGPFGYTIWTISDPARECGARKTAVRVSSFWAADKSEWLSSGRSLDYNNTIYLTSGHVLYSNRSNPMFTILEDRVGRHDFLLTPCSPETFEILYEGHEGYHPSCFENLAKNLEPFGIAGDDIPTTFNVFMNVGIMPSGELDIGPPLSGPGDFVDLRAEMDLIVGVTACSAEKSNNYSFKPIDLVIRH